MPGWVLWEVQPALGGRETLRAHTGSRMVRACEGEKQLRKQTVESGSSLTMAGANRNNDPYIPLKSQISSLVQSREETHLCHSWVITLDE